MLNIHITQTSYKAAPRTAPSSKLLNNGVVSIFLFVSREMKKAHRRDDEDGGFGASLKTVGVVENAEMVQRKDNKPDLSMFKEREIGDNSDGVAPRKSVKPVDHWAFLDEIEAPTWVDLNLEAAFGYKDNDDDWFQITHPFHQGSSRQLISAFSHVGEVTANMDVCRQGPSSPKLPSSVSRSRGKSYRSREWGQKNCRVISSKQYPVKNLSSKASWVNSASGQKVKHKVGKNIQKGNDRSKAKSVCESSLTETARPSGGEPTGAVTSESSEQQHQKLLDISSQTFGHTSGLFSALKVTLRKSCVTTVQAARMEIAGGRQSKGGKSSSGKSSVGSSSYPRYDVTDLILPASQNKDRTPESGSITRMPLARKARVKVLSTSQASTTDMPSKSRWGSKTMAVKLVHQETAKSKDNLVLHSKAMRLHRVNEFVTASTKANDLGVSMCNKRGDGKENPIGRMTTKANYLGASKCNRRGDGKENAIGRTTTSMNTRAGSMVQVQKVRMQVAAPQKRDRKELIGPKEKICGRGEGRSLKNVTQKVHFR